MPCHVSLSLRSWSYLLLSVPGTLYRFYRKSHTRQKGLGMTSPEFSVKILCHPFSEFKRTSPEFSVKILCHPFSEFKRNLFPTAVVAIRLRPELIQGDSVSLCLLGILSQTQLSAFPLCVVTPVIDSPWCWKSEQCCLRSKSVFLSLLLIGGWMDGGGGAL